MRFALFLGLLVPMLSGCPSDIEPGIRNSDPRAEITSHSEGAQLDAGYRTFTGTVEDPDHDVEDLELVWLHDGVEACPPVSPDASGNTTCEIFLESGDSTITLQVEDPLGGIGSDKVSLDVQPYGDPWAEISSPVAGNVYYGDQLIEFSGAVGDDADQPADLEVGWESSLEGVLDIDVQPDSSGGISDFAYLSEGEHAITLTVTNTGGNQTKESVVVEVGPPNSAPSCGIDAPEDGSSYEHGELITFQALVDDVDVPEDWLTATWSSHLDGELGVIPPNSDGSVSLPTSDLSVGSHNVTLTVTDDQEASCTDSVIVTVRDCSTIWYADDDGDGFGDPDSTTTGCEQPTGYVSDDQDCDDGDTAVHPDATEICNGLDDDCDDDIDDDDSGLDTSTASTWYADSDGDSFGEASTSSVACEQPSGYLADASDCDDADATVYPGAPELCDGADDDCDGTVDEDDAIDASTWYADLDGDGYGDASTTSTACSVPSGYTSDTSDCDDTDASINPAADELCDSDDNDCDGTVDEDGATDAGTWHADADGDGYGDATSTTTACSLPSGYLADDTDCDDTRSSVSPGEDELCNGRDDDCDGDTDEDSAIDASTWYQDRDGDGFGDDATTTHACSQPSGYAAYGGDCDDGNVAYNPGAAETDCTDPADYNCDGSTAYADIDGDGYPACEECDDTDATISPSATELCDGVDNNCDGTVDEADAADATSWYADTDADGYGDATRSSMACAAPSGHVSDATDCDDGDASAFPGAPEYCDGSDNDCDGTVDEADATDASTWYADADGDGYGDALSTTRACTAPSGYTADFTDCDDTDAGTNPGVEEYCDGHDDDCDGDTDEDDAADATTWHLDADGDGFGGMLYDVTACSQPTGFVAGDSDCMDSSASTYPGAPEYCNGSDDDCDGDVDEDDAVDAVTWYADADGDGFGDTASTTRACSVPSGCVADATDCDDSSASTHPDADEYCDGHDDDCDGDVDEDSAVDAVTWYLDGDGDGYGLDSSSRDACAQPSGYAAYGGDCDDADTAYNPGATEDDCTDPADYNCDGSIAYTDADGDGWAACEECDDYDLNTYPGADEYCDGHDDDCDGTVDEDDAVDASLWYADIDGDGYGDGGDSATSCSAPTDYVADDTDCDDSSASINPDADEYCDGHDDDCDGDVDEESAVDAVTWYLDGDGDGYGLDSSTRDECSQPSGYAAYGGDCDDADTAYNPGATEDDCTDPADYNCDGATAYIDADGDGWAACEECDDYDSNINPGADEYCDGHDDDCDGAIDEDDALDAGVWYADVDGDGYGDAAATATACTAGSGFGADATDCDDGDATVSPGGVEVCGDGVDNDCDGVLLGCEWSGSTSLSSPDGKFTGDFAHNHAAWSMAGAGDVNSDGFDDFLVSATSYDSFEGAVYLVTGPVTGTAALGTVSAVVLPGVSGERIGYDVTGAGDLDGDGFLDMAVSELGGLGTGVDAGLVYLFSGPLASLSSVTEYTALIVGEGGTDDAGTALAGGDDVDGDGLDDLVIGAPYYTDPAASSGYWHGSTYLFYGPTSGDLSCADADAQIVGTGVGTAPELGSDVVLLEDSNGDGLAEILVGAPVGVDGSGVTAGLAFLFYGPATGTISAASADAEWSGESSGDEAGSSVASAGDVDGDGYGDMLIGSKSEDSVGSACGAVYLVLGPASAGGPLSAAQAKIFGYAADDRLGETAGLGDDFDADGYSDIVVSSKRNDNGGSGSGGAWVFYGPVSGLLHISAADAEFVGASSGVGLGHSLASAGDVDGSGTPDLIVGTISEGTEAGAVYLLLSPTP